MDGVNSLSMVRESNPLFMSDEARAPLLWSFDWVAEGAVAVIAGSLALVLGMKNGVAFSLNLPVGPFGGWLGATEAVSL